MGKVTNIQTEREMCRSFDLSNVNSEKSVVLEKIDSGIPSCQWHRICLDADIPDGSEVVLRFATNDNSKHSPFFSNELTFKCVCRDGYIDAPKGQYLWIEIVVKPYEIEDKVRVTILRSLKIYYPRITLLQYLPGIYSEEEKGRNLLQRYLSLLETILSEKSETIHNLPALFDPEATTPPLTHYDSSISIWLKWLARWVTIDLYEQMPTEGNRKYITLAAQLYKKKGTLEGFAELVTFLVNPQLYESSADNKKRIECRIKEFKNNLFRSYGMEHKGDYNKPDMPGYFQCYPSFRRPSKTFSTNMFTNINTPDDEVHYVYGKNKTNDHFYGSNTICIYIYLKLGDSIVSKEELHTIIGTFLPVFVKAEVVFIDKNEDEYPINKITETFIDELKDKHVEIYSGVSGYYFDTPGWKTFHTYPGNENGETGITNDSIFRTFHSGCGTKFPV